MLSIVLFITDDPESGQMWAFILQQRQMEVILVYSTEEAIAAWEQRAFDLIVIDVQPLDPDGIETLNLMRSEVTIPILFLLPGNNESQMVKAYQSGADECICKPIGYWLFLAKVQSWLSRSWTVPAGIFDSIEVGTMRLEPSDRLLVLADGAPVRLSNLEFRLLLVLMLHPGQVLELGTLIQRVWGYTSDSNGSLLKNVVYRLRRKIEPDPAQPRYIHLVSGKGYVFRP